jgi:Ca2+-binding RTX toxin-like protein
MTTINIDLSTTLQQTLTNAGTGTYVYAFAFGATTSGGAVGLVDSAMVVSNGALTSTTSLDVTAGQFYSGGVYVIIQQGGNGNLLTEISSASDIIQNATAKNYSYQLFEATLGGSTQDLGDISAVNTFGFTSTFEVEFQDGSTDSRGFKASGSDIFTALGSAVADYDPNAFANPGRLATGPAQAAGASPWPSADWEGYVNALTANHDVVEQIQIVAGFTGGTTLQESPMLSHYELIYFPKRGHIEEHFWLVPNTSYGATNTDWIYMTPGQLMENIYVQPGPLEVWVADKEGRPAKEKTEVSFTPNNADGQVTMHLVAGFDAGFWGGSGTSPNPLVTTPINFNQSWNWTLDYAYNASLDPTAVTYTNVLGTGPGTDGGNDRFYDPWAAQFVVNSNAYGYSYSDLVSAGGVNPQVTMWDAGAGTNVQTINITIFDTGETPSSGFKEPAPTYLAPLTVHGYESALTESTNQLQFAFNFSLGSLNFAPNENTPTQLRIYAPDSPQKDSEGFITLEVKGTSGGAWHYYSVENNGGTWSLVATNPGAAGFFDITGLPVTSDGSPAWYQLIFGHTTAQTIYNIYAESDPTTQEFTKLVVDHGVEITENSSTDYTLDFAPGGAMTYDIATFAPPPTGDPNAPGVTIVGSKQNDMVNALNSVGDQAEPTGGADYINGDKGHDYLSGLGGNDIINGGKGVDHLWGNEGDDILQVEGKEGVYDYFNGGTGTDTLQFLGKGSVTLAGFDARMSRIEILDGNDRGLHGTQQMDVFDLSGLQSVDELPFIDGKGGEDILIGSDFDDVLFGGAGNDLLDGGAGNDILDGGKGLNTYVFADGYDNDTIVKYKAGKDIVDLTGVSGVSNFSEIALLMEQIDRKTVLIDFGNGDSLTLQKTTIDLLTANQGDFLFA